MYRQPLFKLKTMKKMKILLNWLPPSMENMPSPALSVLKFALSNSGFDADVLYWNVRLNSKLKNFLNFGNMIYESDFHKMLPFFGYLAIENNDLVLLERLAYQVLQTKPQIHPKGINYIISEFEKFREELNEIIDNYFSSIDLSKYLYIGFSSLFYQWVVASIFAKRIKQINSDIKIMAGGFNTRGEAAAFMRNFPLFDFASWGEGEYSLVELSKFLTGDSEFTTIPNTIHRANNGLIFPKTKNIYVNLNETQFNVSDYIKEIEKYPIEREIVLPFEGGRGCHWMRCHFCYLNAGYKSRVKDVEVIIEELKHYLKENNISTFLFLDNDIVGRDVNRFRNLLKELIELKQEYNNFSILGAEIITKDLCFDDIQKMGVIHFQAVQIGYESPSNNILSKIDKKNTFASNLFFIKWALYFGIKINGANVLKNLLEETSEDIKEGIENLHKLRFYLTEGYFNHNHSILSIAKCSRYFNKIKREGNLETWNSSVIYNSLPNNFVKEEDKYELLLDFIKKEYNSLWDVFEKVETHYVRNYYDYKIFISGESIYYRELYNDLIINEIEFTQNGLHWNILNLCNKRVCSIDSLEKDLSYIPKETTSLKTAIEELSNEGLLYCNSDLSEIVSIINTDKK